MGKPPTDERRKTPRYPARPAAFASLQSDLVRMGQLLDVSRTGIAFTYLEDMDAHKKADRLSEGLELLCAGMHLAIAQSQFRIVRDERLLPDHPFSTLPMRKLAMTFKDLSTEQERCLLAYAAKPDLP